MATTAINLQQEGYIPVSIDAAEAAQRLLRECTSNRMVHVTRLLAVDGVDVNVRDPEGRTPLHVAAEHGVATVVEALIGSVRGAREIWAPLRCRSWASRVRAVKISGLGIVKEMNGRFLSQVERRSALFAIQGFLS